MSITFEKILSFLTTKAANEVKDLAPDLENKPTSIRLKPKTRQFINAQAAALNTSANSIIETILDGVVESTTAPLNSQLRTMRERFFFLFEAHGLSIPQTVSLLQPFGCTTSTLNNPEKLHDLMILPTLNWMAQTFHVKAEWLSGTQNHPITDNVHWYKSLRDAAIRLQELQANNLEPVVLFVTCEGSNFSEAKKRGDLMEQVPLGIVVKLRRKNPDGVDFASYEKWQFEWWNYEPCRVYAKALAMYCEHKGIFTYGYGIKPHELQKLLNNEVLPVTVLKHVQPTWHPEDYVTDNTNIGKDVDELPTVRELHDSAFKGL